MSLDTKVKNLIINTNMTKEQYEAVDDKSNQLFFVEDSSVVDVPSPEENQSGYLHTDGANLTWKEIELGGDYLPLSGGTLTGAISFDLTGGSFDLIPVLKTSFGREVLSINADNSGTLTSSATFAYNLTVSNNLYVKTNIGSTLIKVKKAYIENLNNGADLVIPTTGGTLARVEDLPQALSMPVAASSNAGNVLQYIGETTDKYTNGYFYKSTNDIIQDWFTTGYAQYDTSLTLIVTVDKEKFLAQNPVWQDMGEDTKIWRADYDESTGEWYVWTQQPNIYISNTNLKDVWGVDVTNAAGDYVPASGDTLLIQLSETEEFMWEQVNVQPASEGNALPDQTDNAGKFLTTDGSEVSWGNALANRSTHTNATAIGYNKQISTWKGDIYIGAPSSSTTGKSVGGVVVIGENADTLNGGCYDSIAIGNTARVGGLGAIQLGNGANSDANTFKVGIANGNFEMMDANGNVPLGRLTYVTQQIGDISTALTAILGE